MKLFSQGEFQIPAGMNADEFKAMIAERRKRLEKAAPDFGSARYVGEGLTHALMGAILGAKNSKMDKDEERMFSLLGASPVVPAYQNGTMYHPGGPALVGERGPEVVTMPPGAQVLPFDDPALVAMFQDLSPAEQSATLDKIRQGYTPDEALAPKGWSNPGMVAPEMAPRPAPVGAGVGPDAMLGAALQSVQPMARMGGANAFTPGPGVRVAQNIIPEGVSPTDYRDEVWDDQVADAYDKDAAEMALEWTAGGERADTEKSLIQLREALARLESGADNLSGPLVGSWVGQALAPTFNPESLITKEAIEEVVQRNLRLILGAQFTEKEGERLISRAFNPKLQEPENARRVSRLLASIEDAAKARESAAQYFIQNGTLVGWNGRIPGLEDIEAAVDAGDPAPPRGGDDGWVTLPNGMRIREKQ